MIRSINIHCQGDRNMDNGISCQHVSYSYTDEQLGVAVVCEASSGADATRSAEGARMLCQTTVAAAKSFVKHHTHRLFKGTPFTQTAGEAPKDRKISAAEHELRKLWNEIQSRWTDQVSQHLNAHPLTDEEQTHETTPERRYGCGLTAYVQHKDFWFAMQTGRGCCITFHHAAVTEEETDTGESQQIWQMQTAEESETEPLFRLSFATDGTLPAAAFCCSESVVKAYKSTEDFVNYCVENLKIVVKDGVSTARQQLQDDLPIISRVGTMDDTAVAAVFNLNELRPEIPHYILAQIDYVNRQAAQQQALIHFFVRNKEVPTDELTSAADRLELLNSKIRFLAKEYRTATGKTIDDLPDYSQDLELAKEKI